MGSYVTMRNKKSSDLVVHKHSKQNTTWPIIVVTTYLPHLNLNYVSRIPIYRLILSLSS